MLVDAQGGRTKTPRPRTDRIRYPFAGDPESAPSDQREPGGRSSPARRKPGQSIPARLGASRGGHTHERPRRLCSPPATQLIRWDAHGNTPLWTAVFNSRGDGDVIRLLRSHGADSRHVNAAGRTP